MSRSPNVSLLEHAAIGGKAFGADLSDPIVLGKKFGRWVEFLEGELVERGVAIRLALLAPVARQHLLLLGDPGTAKTQLARLVTDAFDGKLFTTLLTKFSVPEDVFGPPSLPELEKGVYARQTAGYLPTADVAFVDEIFKANASILNSLLSILNERLFFNGSQPEEVPLLAMIAASNEVPDEDDGLDALDDRIVLRTTVDAIAEASGFAKMLRGGSGDNAAPPPFTGDDVKRLHALIERCQVGEEVMTILLETRAACREAGLSVSDRRWRQATQAMAACAVLDGKHTIEPAHVAVLRYALWRRPDDEPRILEALRAGLSRARLDSLQTSVEDLLDLGRERLAALETLQEQVRSCYRNDWEGAARETMHKRDRMLQNLETALRQIEEHLAGALGLWTPFWADLLPGEELRELKTQLETHPVLRAVCDEEPELAAELGLDA